MLVSGFAVLGLVESPSNRFWGAFLSHWLNNCFFGVSLASFEEGRMFFYVFCDCQRGPSIAVIIVFGPADSDFFFEVAIDFAEDNFIDIFLIPRQEGCFFHVGNDIKVETQVVFEIVFWSQADIAGLERVFYGILGEGLGE